VFQIPVISLRKLLELILGTRMKTRSSKATFVAIHLLAAAVAGLASPAAEAASESGHLAVSATIPAQCAVGDAALAIGPITIVNSNGTTSTVSGGAGANIPWGCTNGTSATLAFSMGSNSTGTDRRLVSATAGSAPQYLEYQLKAGSAGGVTIGTTPVTLEGADGTNKTFTVWGAPVSSAANRTVKPAGDYTDSVLLTITFAP
jgi:spore coat protein U-like protein